MQKHNNTSNPVEPTIDHLALDMSRKEFHGYLYDAYGGERTGDQITADRIYCHAISHVEVITLPDGPVVAIHSGTDDVTVVKPVMVSSDDARFVADDRSPQ